ncbi:MAG: hypothetical protein RTU30_00145 [Candidatus Thorarchaeota archaeon]
MQCIEVYLKEWDHLLKTALKTIETIEQSNAWDFRLWPTEFTVKETFHHTVQAIFEDAGKWYLKESLDFQSSGNSVTDIQSTVDRMKNGIEGLSNDSLSEPFTFPWGTETTIEGAIQQNLFHAIGHFAQLRERAGVYRRQAE